MPADGLDTTIHDLLALGVTALIAAYALWALVSLLQRSRPGLAIGGPVAAALCLRVVATAAVSLTGIGQELRGGDEIGFRAEAGAISEAPFGSGAWADALTGSLYKFVFAIQLGAVDSPELALRVTQAAIAVAGLALLAVAVYELVGPRAALISMWVLAFEPTNIFFSTLLHKEANMILASGLVAFGGAVIWRRSDLRAVAPIVLGCLIAVATRPYVGWFLIAAGAATMLHAGLRAEHRGSARALSLVCIVILFAAVAAPTVLEASTDESLEANLQSSQDANVSDESNLKLEQVDFSSRSAILGSLPQRIRDVVFRPYPWQVDNPSQRFGLLGTLVALSVLVLLGRGLIRNRGEIMARAGPLIYTGFFLLIAYSLSAGNAGTAFRYRTHIVAVAACIAVALWHVRSQRSSIRSSSSGRAEPSAQAVAA